MATPLWARKFSCTWINEGRLDMSGFRKDMPACLKLYLTSIRWSEEWTEALEMIQDGEGHCFANETGIVFSKESASDPSSEELPNNEVAFFAGCFPKDRVKKTVFLSIMETCLKERRKQCKCPALDGEEQFLDYVHSETKSKGATDQELTGQEIKGKRKKSPEVVPVRSKIRRSERSPDVASGRSMRIGGKIKSEKRHLGQTSDSAPSVKRPKKEVTSVLLVNETYGTSHGGISILSRQVAQFLKLRGAIVHSTALHASEEDKQCAMEDGVTLHLPVQRTRQTPSLEWLTFYHSIHYPDIPQDLKCIVGHTDITSHAAKSIQEDRCQHAKLVLFNHDMPEDTEYYKGTMKEMTAGKKMEDILEHAKNADAVFSLGRRIYDYFETQYKSLGESRPRHHFLFLPRPSPVFDAIFVRPGARQKVVLSVGGDTEVESQKGHGLVARAMEEVAEKIRNVRLCVCGSLEDIEQEMQRAHLVLMPSRAEPFGLIGLEAIAAGIPVLISNESSLADMVKDLIKEKKCPADMRDRIVETSRRESVLIKTAKKWAERIVNMLKFFESELKKAAEFKKALFASRYWEESHQNLLRVCGLIDSQ